LKRGRNAPAICFDFDVVGPASAAPPGSCRMAEQAPYPAYNVFILSFITILDNQMFTDTINKCAANAARIARLSKNSPLGF
jgi:nitrite transporter NirC